MLLYQYLISLLSITNILGQLNREDNSRKLFGEVCPANETLIEHYFEVIISIHPDATITAICTLGDQMKMGHDINSILSSHVSFQFKNKTKRIISVNLSASTV
jgi:hypothetical protein